MTKRPRMNTAAVENTLPHLWKRVPRSTRPFGAVPACAWALVTVLLLRLFPAVPTCGAFQRPVYVTAGFVDRNNLFIEDLAQDEIEVYEGGQLRKIEFQAQEELPTVYGLVFDRAMLGVFPEDERGLAPSAPGAMSARNVAYELIDRYFGKHVVGVGSYGRDPQVALDFTSDGFRAHRAIQQLQGQRRPEESFLYASLMSAIRQMSRRHEQRRVLVYFLESADVRTLDRIKPLKNAVSASNVELFFIRFGSRMASRTSLVSPQMSEAAMRDLASATAGEVFIAASYGQHMEDLTRRMLNHVRTLYTIGFQAHSARENPAPLSIRCKRPGSKVRSRSLVPALP